ncbi:MAG: rod shape-determining protein MreD [Acidobacteria bacterium]|nr:rod shape-determining protein MreD [Acidobacteriota bacterium]
MKSAKIAVAVLAALLLQVLVARYLRLRYLDLVLVVTVYSCFSRDPVSAMLIGAVAGLVQDGFSSGLMGSTSFTKTVVAFLAGTLSIRIALEKLFPRLVVMAAATLASGLIYVGIHRLFGIDLVGFPVLPQLARHMGWQVLANVAAAAVVFRLLDLVSVEKERRDRGRVPRRFMV